jgi:hypothetical protein
LHIENQALTIFIKKFQKKLLKKFANQKNSRTFVTGMRKQGSLDGIILLVISFSVINYVVSEASACEGRRFRFIGGIGSGPMSRRSIGSLLRLGPKEQDQQCPDGQESFHLADFKG